MPVNLYQELYHITHVRNLQGIKTHGLLSKAKMISLGLATTVDISDPEVQEKRDKKLDPIFGLLIHEYVPLYFNPKNAMLSRRREQQNDLAILAIPLAKAAENTVYLFTDGNAANNPTQFGTDIDIAKLSDEILKANYWADKPDGKRKRCAEMLVHEKLPAISVIRAHCLSIASCSAARTILGCEAVLNP